MDVVAALDGHRWASFEMAICSISRPILRLVAAYLGHGANGWWFDNKGGGLEYPVFWAIACFSLALIGSGAHALRSDDAVYDGSRA